MSQVPRPACTHRPEGDCRNSVPAGILGDPVIGTPDEADLRTGSRPGEAPCPQDVRGVHSRRGFREESAGSRRSGPSENVRRARIGERTLRYPVQTQVVEGALTWVAPAGVSHSGLFAQTYSVRHMSHLVNPDETGPRAGGCSDVMRSGPADADNADELLRGLPGMRAVMAAIRDLARLDVPVLIEGEPGTGVEFVAQEIHRLSPRSSGPFYTVSCAAMAEPTLRSQLWGYARGAFADTVEDRPGVFELAEGGTVFIEEVRDIPGSLQVLLARMLKTHAVTRLGESVPRHVNARLICATQYNLIQEAAEGRVALDLLYKIRVAQISVAPLRERRVDIPLLTAFHLRKSRLMPEKPIPGVSDEAMRLLLDYSWPGNLTELQSAIEFAALRCAGPALAPADLPAEIVSPGLTGPLSARPGQTEKDRYLAAMAAAKGNRTVAARLLGVSRATLYRRLKELKIGPAE